MAEGKGVCHLCIKLHPLIDALCYLSYAAGSVSQGNPAQTMVRNSNNNLIAVQMQYRLGPFGTTRWLFLSMQYADQVVSGFLSGETVAKDGTLNAGLCPSAL